MRYSHIWQSKRMGQLQTERCRRTLHHANAVTLTCVNLHLAFSSMYQTIHTPARGMVRGVAPEAALAIPPLGVQRAPEGAGVPLAAVGDETGDPGGLHRGWGAAWWDLCGTPRGDEARVHQQIPII